MLTSEALVVAMLVVHILMTIYFVLNNASQIAMGALATAYLWQHRRRHTRRARALSDRLASPPLVSVVVPACNEELTIVETVTALLALEYEAREIVVVNDGSTDGTLAVLQRRFGMLPAPLAFVEPIATRPVRGIYRSIAEPNLVVIDKENGGCKADAANAGINAASGVLVLIVDADTVLEPDALDRAVMPFLEDPRTVAVGANVGIANGCSIEHGRIGDVGLPRNWLARFQIIEYMRSFLLFRIACASVNSLLIISGAFGLFRRDAVIAVGGYDRTAIGEDMDLTIRLHRHFRRTRQPFRIAFDPNPLCWTQAPEDWRSLQSQRCRWRRGLLQVLWRHARLMLNPRFGVVGLCAFPHQLVYEGVGPLLEVIGYTVTTVAAILGVLSWEHYRVLIVVSLLFGTANTLLAVLLSDVTSPRYTGPRELAILMVAAVVENFGYRQLNSWWGLVGSVQAAAGTGGWGVMKRRAFEGDEARV